MSFEVWRSLLEPLCLSSDQVGFDELEVEDWTWWGEVWTGWIIGVISAGIYGPKAGDVVQSTRLVEYEIASQVCAVYTLQH
jgi:hypothetical protein